MFHSNALVDFQTSSRSSSEPPIKTPDNFLHSGPNCHYSVQTYQTQYDQLKEQNEEDLDFRRYTDNNSFEQVMMQNPYLVHRKVLETIRMEFALEDEYESTNLKNYDSVKVRKRRKPQECDWKPESIYKIYVECKPEFFEKSDYQDNISSQSCFGKINMRIPRAWSRKPNKAKRRKTSQSTNSTAVYEPVETAFLEFNDIMGSPSATVSELPANINRIYPFDFMFS